MTTQPPVPPPGGPSGEDKFFAEYHRSEQIWTTVRLLGGLAVGGLLLLAAYPLATTIAGKNTTVNVTVGLYFGVTMTGVAAVVATYTGIQRRQVKYLKARNRRLARKLREAGGTPDPTDLA